LKARKFPPLAVEGLKWERVRNFLQVPQIVSIIIQKEGLAADGPWGDCFPLAHRLPTVLLTNQKEKIMKNREKLLDEVSELALQNDMTYFG
jgi:hypothetical protein